MSSPISVWLWVLAALVAANLAFVSPKFVWVWRSAAWADGKKPWGWHVLEMLLYYALVLALGFALEHNQGQLAPQRWEFFAVTLCLFVTLAFPGFVWRFLLRQRP
jgi:hypothetical protein